MNRQKTTYSGLFPACFILTVGIILLFSSNSRAQIGIRYPYPANNVVSFTEESGIKYGLGIKMPFSVPLPAEVLKIDRNVEIDRVLNRYIIREEYLGNQYKIPRIIDLNQVSSIFRRNDLLSLWHNASARNVNSTSPSRTGARGMNIRIPVPIRSETFNRIVGGGGVIGLSVDGEVSINGNLVHTDRSQVKDVFRGSDYTFRLQQTQRFRITGKVGEKITVAVDQASDRDFDLQNNIRLRYQGDADEIFQSIEAGNVSLSLPGTQFITFSGVNRGLFGFKTVSRLGPLNITSIASLERGQKKSMIIRGGASSQKRVIKDYDFLKGVYFFIDERYRDIYGFTDGGLFRFNPSDEIAEFELWKSGANFNTDPEAKSAWAVWDPKGLTEQDTVGGGNRNNIKRHFKRLIPNQDYTLNKDLGYIVLRQSVRNEVLAIAYNTITPGDEVGDIIPPDELNPPETKPFILKLLRTDNPHPVDLAWSLEWRNVYQLSSGQINPEGFEMLIVRNNPLRDQIQDGGLSFLEVFGLDRMDVAGSPGSDGVVDVGNPNIFNYSLGHMIMPGRRPFDPVDGKDPFGGFDGTSQLADSLRIKELYDNLFLTLTDLNKFSKFEFEFSFSSESKTFNLGFNIIEGSEELYLDGQLMLRGIDYDIDYSFGVLTILNNNALQPGKTIEVKYESGEIFQLDKKTLLGTNVKFSIGKNANFGGTALFLSERIIDTRISVGQEPKQNFVWGFNSNISFQPQMITSILDKLPFIRTTAPTTLSFQGEFAQSLPNPNTLSNEATGDHGGVAYLDDFEGSKRVSFLGIMRRTWKISSLPIFINPITKATTDLEQKDRVKMMWYNPYQQITIKDIFPGKQINARTQNLVNVLNIGFLEDSRGRFPDNPWGGIMKWTGQSYFNQSESKFLEMWVKGENGVITIDFGLISEDAVPNGVFDTEDGITTGFLNNILDPDEDVGLWHNWNVNHPPEEQWDDEWSYVTQSNDYTNVNGTKNNGDINNNISGGMIPDTEDIDRDGALDLRNEFFQASIDLGNDLVSGKYKISGPNDKGWKLYRIPLADFTPVSKPNWGQIEYVRLWFTGLQQNELISIYNIDLVGNAWKELGVADNDSLVRSGNYSLQDSSVVVDVVNTEDNFGQYSSPPNVEGRLDRITGVRAREQSLEMRFDNLKHGQSAAIQTVFVRDRNIIHYRRFKLFVYGDPLITDHDTSSVEFFIQLGFDQNNYYEVRKPIYEGWDERNAIDIDLWELPKLKTEVYEGGKAEFENGEKWRIVGNPTFQKLRITTIGVKNRGDFPVTGFIWVDEMRVSEIDKASGMALRANFSLNLAGFGTVSGSVSKREADFHTLNDQFGSFQNTNVYSLNFSGFRVEKIFPFLSSFSIPVSYSFNRSGGSPKYLLGSDVLYSSDVPGASLENVSSYSSSYSTSFSKRATSRNWLIKSTLEALSLNYSRQFSSTRDRTYELNRRTGSSAQISHRLTIRPRFFEPFKYFSGIPLLKNISETKVFYLPSRVSSSISATESSGELKLRKSDEAKPSQSLSASRNFSTAFSPLENLSFTVTKTTTNDLSHLKDRTKLISELFNDTTATSTNLAVQGNYKPKILVWLSPNVKYNSTFDMRINPQLRSSGKSASTSRNITASFSVSLRDLVSKIYKLPESDPASGGTGRTPPTRRTPSGQVVIPPGLEKKPEEEEEQEEEDTGGIAINPLYYISKFTQKLTPISISFDRRSQTTTRGLEGSPSLAYQFGFSEDPGVPLVEKLGKNTGGKSDDSSMRLSSSLRLFQRIGISLRFDKSSRETNKGNNQSGNSSTSMLIFRDIRIPMAEYSLQVNNLNRIPFLDKITNSISLSHNYTGRRSLNWTGNSDNLTSTKFDWGFSPLARVSISMKKGVNISFAMNRTNSLTLDISGAETKVVNGSFTMSTSYFLDSGFKLPLPFGILKDKRISNKINFSMDINRTNSATWQKPPAAEDFKLRNQRKSLTISPRMTYSFTDRVSGGFNFRWQVNENNRSGKDVTTDFGLSVRIKIVG